MKIDSQKIAKQHKFCFICGGKMAWRQDNLLICSNCGYRKYINPTPTNAAVLENTRGEILLVRRKVDPKKGYWDLPGGFVSVNETLEQSVERELEEELGVKIKNLKYAGSKYDVYTYDKVVFPTLGMIFSGKIGDQKLTPADDISGYKFFKKEEIPFDKIAFKSLKEVLKNYIKNR